jgi:5-methylthioadenosine/S-adenosylhomocysteine deaminase
MVNGKWLMRNHKLLTVQEEELLAQAAEFAKKIDTFLIEREQSVLSKLIALGGSMEEESFEAQIKVKLTEGQSIVEALKTNGIEIVRHRHFKEHDAYFAFNDPLQGRLRYREDDFLNEQGSVTMTRARLTLLGQKREGALEHNVLLSRSRFLAPATQSLRFYREYFKPKEETSITKDRQRWLIKFKDTEFFVNQDTMLEPEIGRFVEVKSRTWSRRDAEHKAGLAHELLAALGISNAERMTSDYIEVVKSA